MLRPSLYEKNSTLAIETKANTVMRMLTTWCSQLKISAGGNSHHVEAKNGQICTSE